MDGFTGFSRGFYMTQKIDENLRTVDFPDKKIKPSKKKDSLPTIFDLRGIAPNLTGGLSSEEFLRRVRK